MLAANPTHLIVNIDENRREVADAIPNGRYLEIPATGHLGFIERPQVVNAAAMRFFADSL